MKKFKLQMLPSMQCDEGCGECCGIVPVTETEFRRIERYAKENGIMPVEQEEWGTCPMYQDGKCSVYPVRPLICRVFGHAEDLPCPRGYNTNVPQEEVNRMILANGQSSRIIHEMLPGFDEGLKKWQATRLLQSDDAQLEEGPNYLISRKS